MLTQELLKELLDYDEETGVFTWRKRVSNIRTGSCAGSTSKISGYVEIGIQGRLYLGHRLVFLWVEGRMPEHDVDHANGNKSDNRWANLRKATRSQNNVNTTKRAVSADSGIRGVSLCKSTGRWRAVISVGNKPLHLGRFDTKEEAARAYAAAAVSLHGAFVPQEVAAIV